MPVPLPSASTSIPPPTRSLLASLALVVAMLASAVFVSACGTTTHARAAAYSGDVLPHPVTLSGADLSDVFQSSVGGQTSLSQQQRGLLMLLYFGYTHCPDVCPTTMADLGTALRQLPTNLQNQVQVVFVTSDPARDTPAVMKIWLQNFDAALPRPFVGLTASNKQIDAVATSVGVPIAPPVKAADGTITVQHGAQTLAFRNGQSSLLWTAGTTPTEYASDIRLLLGAKK